MESDTPQNAAIPSHLLLESVRKKRCLLSICCVCDGLPLLFRLDVCLWPARTKCRVARSRVRSEVETVTACHAATDARLEKAVVYRYKMSRSEPIPVGLAATARRSPNDW